MAYAVVHFIDDNLSSEIPTNWLHKEGNDCMCWWPPPKTKNTKSYIKNRVEPDIKNWILVPVRIEKYCETFEKARKIAENENYTSADDHLQLGKGLRKKIPSSRYISPEDSDSLSDESNNNDNTKNLQLIKGSQNRKSKLQKYNKDVDIHTQKDNNNSVIERHTASKLPEWPSSIVDSINNSQNTKLADEIDTTHDISLHQVLPHTSTCQSIAENQSKSNNSLNWDNSHNNEELKKYIRDIKVNTETLLRMSASLDLQIKDITRNMNKLGPNMRCNVSTERVKNMLPLQSIDDIKTIEVLLKEESFQKEYKTFIVKIGGHSPKETIRNVLSRIFSNECSMKCSWKGRRQNFGVGKLTLISIVKEIMLEQHTALTERELDDLAAEWFRFGKQRFKRETKNLEDSRSVDRCDDSNADKED